MKDYADFLLDDLDKDHLISRRMYRGSCTFSRGNYLKDLSKIKKDLRKIIIVDNLKENMKLQADNGITIKGWYNDNPNDTELIKIGKGLKDIYLSGQEDVRPLIRDFLKKPKRTFSIHSPVKLSSPNKR
jgi:CTD small phosphatase-like protein 2